MRRVLIAALPGLLIFFTACGGGDEPPPEPKTKAGLEALKDLVDLANNAKAVCCSTYAPYMAANCVESMSISENSTEVQTSSPNEPAPLPDNKSCSDAITNFNLFYKTIDNGAYANTPEARQWWMAQGGAIVTCVGSEMAANGASLDPEMYPQYYACAQPILAQIDASLPGIGVNSMVPPIPGVGPQPISPQPGGGAVAPPPVSDPGLADGSNGIPLAPPRPIPQPVRRGVVSLGGIVCLDATCNQLAQCSDASCSSTVPMN